MTEELSCDDRLDDEARKSRIRESNKEFAKRMAILQVWSDHWTDYTTRQGEAYPQMTAREILRTKKKITCPINSCGKAFTSIGGLKYHYARCNITKTFSCKKCDPRVEVSTRGELLRHMILTHIGDLPPLSEEQKEIVSSYVRCDSRSDRKRSDRRSAIFSDNEQPLAGARVVKAAKELLQNFAQDENVENYFSDWLPKRSDWQILGSPHKEQYFPPEISSVRFKIDSEHCWNDLTVGTSKVLCQDDQNEPSSYVFFTGGINTSVAWLPKPAFDEDAKLMPEMIAVSVDCCSMNTTHTYKVGNNREGSIQFWTLSKSDPADEGVERKFKRESRIKLSFSIGHEYGRIYDMSWCPCGTSWQSKYSKQGSNNELPRAGLLALACGDGQIRILTVPHPEFVVPNFEERHENYSSKPMFKVRPIATLLAPGVGPSTDYQPTICKTLFWGISKKQSLIVAGYGNGNVAMFDLSNKSPILHSIELENSIHVYNPLKSWNAHGAAVTGVAVSHENNSLLVATASIDRQLKIWNTFDLSQCVTMDKTPLTKLCWDFRARGIITASDSAFTGFNNRVSYRYPTFDGHQSTTVSTHRSTVWGLSVSFFTNAVATSDAAGEVFVTPALINRSNQKRDRNNLSANSLYTMIPAALGEEEKQKIAVKRAADIQANAADESRATSTVPSQIESDIEESCLDVEADFSAAERQVVNKPTKFLLPIQHKPIISYQEFEKSFGVEFVHYAMTHPRPDDKLSESCARASDLKQIYCDRACDYPFCSINCVAWSPNVSTYSYLISATQIGLCRVDKVEIVEQIYQNHINCNFSNCNNNLNL